MLAFAPVHPSDTPLSTLPPARYDPGTLRPRCKVTVTWERRKNRTYGAQPWVGVSSLVPRPWPWLGRSYRAIRNSMLSPARSMASCWVRFSRCFPANIAKNDRLHNSVRHAGCRLMSTPSLPRSGCIPQPRVAQRTLGCVWNGPVPCATLGWGI
jgi:hypothetical protein